MKRVISTLLAFVFLAGVLAMPASAAMLPMEYGDVTEDDWFYEAVEYCHLHGLIGGVSEAEFGPDGELVTPGVFAPEMEMTRAMFVTLIGRVAARVYWTDENGEIDGYDIVVENPDEYYDLDPEATWYVTYMQWAYERGIINGYEPGVLAPDDPITREQMAVILCNFAAELGVELEPSPDVRGVGSPLPVFIDFMYISDWAYDSVITCYESGLISGYVENFTYFRPHRTTQRDQAAQIIYNLLTICDIQVPAGDIIFR